MTDTPTLIDLHVHTLHRSLDSGLRPHDLVAAVHRLGLSAICITEHNAVWTDAEARELEERAGLVVLRGMEVSTDAGHVLTFGLDRYTHEMATVERLRRIVEAEGGVMVLAHPTRSPGFGRPWSDAAGLFEALECLNGDDYTSASDYLFGIARGLGLPGTGGSDAHSAQAVGRCVTRFHRPIANEAELIAAIRDGGFEPLLLTEQGGVHTFISPAGASGAGRKEAVELNRSHEPRPSYMADGVAAGGAA